MVSPRFTSIPIVIAGSVVSFHPPGADRLDLDCLTIDNLHRPGKRLDALPHISRHVAHWSPATLTRSWNPVRTTGKGWADPIVMHIGPNIAGRVPKGFFDLVSWPNPMISVTMYAEAGPSIRPPVRTHNTCKQ